ncbi:AbrB/MazE/SpoVT family DNA-binding domain-containing protein [Chengkuizengella marina]|uniref:AbrB family transcriptional regulator n=1 Tax=Chengkuizengella marina TaxID=2507566 RepID=A0A6N9PY35_9BACL|nr:AbrB family transcriptional regulator [Chengkuizengella marina]NBI27525.1 AbrB family transcriptional regulator [Chengkuizengella marina]
MDRKVTKIGNSLGVTMTDALKKINANLGDNVSVEVDEKEETIIIKKTNKVDLPRGFNPKFLKSMQKIVDRYDETFIELKDR